MKYVKLSNLKETKVLRLPEKRVSWQQKMLYEKSHRVKTLNIGSQCGGSFSAFLPSVIYLEKKGTGMDRTLFI